VREALDAGPALAAGKNHPRKLRQKQKAKNVLAALTAGRSDEEAAGKAKG